MSSAILYLAIVAIWAVILVPLLVRKSHDGSGAGDAGNKVSGQASETASGSPADGSPADGSPADGVHAAEAHAAGAVHADGLVHEHGVSVDHGVAFEYDASFEYGEVRAGNAVLEYETAVEYGSAVEYDAGHDDHTVGGDEAGSPDDDVTEPVLTLRGRPLWSEGPGWHPLRRQDRPRPVVTREAALRARRRMLTTLVTLTVVALALAAEGMAPWRIIVPPVGMLGLLVLLLHEAARADAEVAERRAAAYAAHAARAAQLAARQRATREAQVMAAPEPTAQIIDISARVSDQLYDQYADAAVRAVGD